MIGLFLNLLDTQKKKNKFKEKKSPLINKFIIFARKNKEELR